MLVRTGFQKRKGTALIAFCFALMMANPQPAEAVLTPEQQEIYNAVMAELKAQNIPLHYISINSSESGASSNYNNDGATGKDSMAIGVAAKAEGEESIAIGRSAVSFETSSGGIAVGAESKTYGLSDLALGMKAQTGTKEQIGDFSTAVGYEATTLVSGAVALGSKSIAAADKGSAGYDPKTGIASTIDTFIWKSGAGAVSIGDTTNADASEQFTRQLTGLAAGSKDTDAVNVAQLKASQLHYFSVNDTNFDSPTPPPDADGATNYNNDTAYGKLSIAIGHNTQSKGEFDLFVGSKAGYNNTPMVDTVNSGTTNGENTGIGTYAGQRTMGSQNTSFGFYSGAIVTGFRNLAVGSMAGYELQGNNNISMGYSAGRNLKGNANIVSGFTAGQRVAGTGNVITGYKAGQDMKGDGNVAIGWEAGKGTVGNYTVALGLGAQASKESAVAIGAASVADRAAFTVSTIAPYSKADLNGVTLGALSVGGNGKLRQIINLADGTEDTDAVNIRQLKAVADSVVASDALSVKYDNATKDKITLGGIGTATPATTTPPLVPSPS